MSEPRIARQMLQPGVQLITDGDKGPVGSIPFGPGLGSLELGVHRFDEPVAQAAAEVFEDAVPMRTHVGREALERRQPATACPTDPAIQQMAGLLRTVPGLVHAAQGFLQTRGPGGLQPAALQPVHHVQLRTAPVAGILEQGPAAAAQVRLGLDLGPSHLILRPAGQGQQVERIKAHLLHAVHVTRGTCAWMKALNWKK